MMSPMRVSPGPGSGLCVAAFCLLSGACGVALAQTYPARAVRIVVPYPPGGPTDIISRLVAQKLADAFGQPVLVENKAGAGGGIGSEFVAHAQPDGYVLLWGTGGTHGINPSLYPSLPYDAVKDFAPVSLVGLGTNVLVVNPSVGAATVGELVAIARARPGALNFGSSGNGATSHLGGELFKTVAGLKIAHVPFKGAAPAIVALVSGEVELAILDMPALLPHIRSGKLRALGVASANRSKVLPDVPTLIESGLQGMNVSSWHGLFAPAGTQRAIVSRLSGEVSRLVRLPDVAERFMAQGAEPVGSTPEQLAGFVNSELDRWSRVVKASGAKLD